MKRIGMLTPSSNTILEPETFAMLSALPDVSVHFGRFSVTEITLSDKGVGQFDIEPMLTAARLLAEAKVDCINGMVLRQDGSERTATRSCVPASAKKQAFHAHLSCWGSASCSVGSECMPSIWWTRTPRM